MFKRSAVVILMYTAYAILLGHSITPHHHHNGHYEITEHHNTEHHHHHDGEHHDNGLSDLFSHFLHADDAFTTTINHSLSKNFSRTIFSFVSILTNDFYFENLQIPDWLFRPPPERVTCISPHSLSVGLRAPPVTFC